MIKKTFLLISFLFLGGCFNQNLSTSISNYSQFDPALSGDGRKLAFIISTKDGQKKLRLEDVSSGKYLPLRHLIRYQPFSSPSLSWNGRYIAVISKFQNRKIVLIEDIISGKFYRIPIEPDLNLQKLSLSPDASKLVVSFKRNQKTYLKFLDLSQNISPDIFKTVNTELY